METVDIAALVRAARAQRGLKQGEMATLLGMERDKLGRIERGALRNVRVLDALAIERVLGIPFEAWREAGVVTPAASAS